MKPKIFPIMIIVFILCIIIGIMYFLIQNNSNTVEKTSQIDYKTISVLKNIKLGILEFDFIHPYLTQNREIIYLDTLIFEPLLSITEDYNISNCLAKEWSKIGEKSYVIKLKEDIKWSNGEKLTTQDVKYSIEELQKRDKSIYYENVKDILEIDIIDNYTLRIETIKQIPYFEYNLIFPIIHNKQYLQNNIENLKELPIGTGQYKIIQIQNNKIEFAINEEWRNTKLNNANIKTITIYLYNSIGEIYNDFKKGKIDLIHTTNFDIEKYIGSMGYEKKIYSGREYEYLAFNCANVILQYPEVRQAIKNTLNQEKIVKTTLENKVIISYFPISKENYLLKNLKLSYETNIEKSKKILEDAGWKYENNIWQKEIQKVNQTLNFKLSVSKSNTQRVIVAKEIQNQLETLGIKIEIEQITDEQYQNYLKNHEYEILLTGIYTPLSPDISSFFSEGNLANYKNEEIDTILLELNNITDNNLREEKYKKIIEIYNKEVPYLGLYCNKNIIAYTTNFRGEIMSNNYNIYYNFSNWYIEN